MTDHNLFAAPGNIYNKDGSIEYTGPKWTDGMDAPEPAQAVKSTTEDEYQMRQVRQLALQHAVTTHGATHDDDQVVAAAKAYVAFLTGKEPERVEVTADHAKQWEDAVKNVRWPVPSSTFTTPADSLAGPAPLRSYNPYG